jgi:tetratricopeptide (TPR) repeat protein
MELFTTPDGKEPLAHREEMIAKYGVRVLDMVRASWQCAKCGAPVPAESLILPVVEYRSLDEATQFFHRFVGDLASQPAQVSGVPGQELAVQIRFPVGRPIACPACGGAPALRDADVHLFSSAHQRDLVLHLAGQAAPQLLVGGAPTERTPALDASFARDSLVRALEVARESDDVQATANAMAQAAARIPGDEDAMKFLPFLNDHGAYDAVLAMADATARAQPNRADGPFWRAQVLMQQSNATRDAALGQQAKGLLDRALQLDPGHADASVALANLSRLAGRDDEAERILSQLLQHKPDHAVANYTLGLVLLPKRPADALGCFERGERSAPNDADYPRSRARAFAALGRLPEAQAAIGRALELAPDDPRVHAVASEIQGQNPMAKTIKLVVRLTVAFVLLAVVGIVAYVLWSSGVFR